MGKGQEALHRLTAAEARARLARGEITARALLEACLARIAEREQSVGAWSFLDADAARARADVLDRAGVQGPLHGIPIGVKDIIDTARMPTALGSPAFEGRQPSADASCVALLEQAGAIILGKNVTTELAYFTPGKTRNPRDPARTPGGSSSGSAAAVADSMVPLSIGTQAAGSTIRPASFCGVPAFKPTHGRWDMSGALRLYPTVDTLSVFARDFADAAMVDAVLGGGDAFAPRQPSRVLVFEPAEWDLAGPATREVLQRTAAALAARGVPVHHARAEGPLAQLVEASDIIIHVEAAQNAPSLLAGARMPLSARFLELLEAGARIPESRYRDALAIRAAARAAWAGIVRPDTLVLTPAVPAEAPIGLGATGDPVFIRGWNVIGAPAANLPLGTGPSGMPVGVQAVGVPGEDTALLCLVAWTMAELSPGA